MALVGTLVHHRSASVRAEVTRMFWEIAGAHGICPEVHYPVPEFATLAGGNWVHRIPRALAALKVGLYNPIACPRAAHVQLQSPPGQHPHAAHRQAAAPRHMLPDGATHHAVAEAPPAAPPLPRQRQPVADGGAGMPQPVRRQTPSLLLPRAGAHQPPRVARRFGPPFPHHRHAGRPPEAPPSHEG